MEEKNEFELDTRHLYCIYTVVINLVDNGWNQAAKIGGGVSAFQCL